MLLYHGTTIKGALGILQEGFDFKKSGSCWGNTYGKGIYFTPNYETAKFYAGSDGMVLSFNIKINEYLLKKDISPSTRKRIKIDKEKYNCIVSPNKDEYLILYFI